MAYKKRYGWRPSHECTPSMSLLNKINKQVRTGCYEAVLMQDVTSMFEEGTSIKQRSTMALNAGLGCIASS